MSPVEDLSLLDFDRSNKGASKQRRDQINAEIATMRDLLPLPESSRQRLSQLQIMSLTCVYIRKCNVLHKLFRSKSLEAHLPDSLDFFQALTGFLLVTTREGKLLYISENVTDFLGHSMVDMKTQGDSLFDIVDKRDHNAVRSQLLQGGSLDDKLGLADVSFFCRMNMSRTLKRQSGFGDVKVMHVRGHFISTGAPEAGCPVDSQYVFMATCSPLITPDLKENLIQNNTMVFKTVHQLDMTYYEVTKTAEYHLGLSSGELYKKSWYSMLHPEDIHEAKEKHMQLIRSNHEMGCMMTVRMLRGDGSIFWVNLVMHVRQASLAQNDEPLIVCINQVIDAQEAFQIKVQGHMLSLFPNRPNEMWGNQFPPVLPTGQEGSGGHWSQKLSPLPMSNYQTNIPSYIAQGGHHSMYNPSMSGVSSCGMEPSPQDLNDLIASPMDQTDQLKARLKRKIQGPHSATCKPNKQPRSSWDMDRSSDGSRFPDMDQGFQMMDQFSHPPMTGGHSDCSGQQMMAVQPRYRVSELMTVKSSHKYMSRGGMISSLYSAEQVVPDVNVPDSYLTPDPSPVSSPEPSSITVKTEVMDMEAGSESERTSQEIFKALEKLVAHPQKPRFNSLPVETPVAAPLTRPMRKELPVFDAFDIDDFFDTLKTPDPESKSSFNDIAKLFTQETKTSSQLKATATRKEIKLEIPDDPVSAENIPNFAALKEEIPFCYTPGYSCRQTRMQTSTLSPSLSSTMSDTFYEPNITIGFMPHVPVTRLQVTTQMGSMDDPSPVSTQDKIDDLLSYFSDDGSDVCSLQTSSSSFYLDQSSSSGFIGEDCYQKPCSIDHMGSCQGHVDGQLSPMSSSSLLSEEDELTLEDDHSTDMLDNRLDQALSTNTFKDREVLSMQLDFSDFFPSAEGSLDFMKHSQ